jgi:hypothetical protein
LFIFVNFALKVVKIIYHAQPYTKQANFDAAPHGRL